MLRLACLCLLALLGASHAQDVAKEPTLLARMSGVAFGARAAMLEQAGLDLAANTKAAQDAKTIATTLAEEASALAAQEHSLSNAFLSEAAEAKDAQAKAEAAKVDADKEADEAKDAQKRAEDAHKTAEKERKEATAAKATAEAETDKAKKKALKATQAKEESEAKKAEALDKAAKAEAAKEAAEQTAADAKVKTTAAEAAQQAAEKTAAEALMNEAVSKSRAVEANKRAADAKAKAAQAAADKDRLEFEQAKQAEDDARNEVTAQAKRDHAVKEAESKVKEQESKAQAAADKAKLEVKKREATEARQAAQKRNREFYAEQRASLAKEQAEARLAATRLEDVLVLEQKKSHESKKLFNIAKKKQGEAEDAEKLWETTDERNLDKPEFEALFRTARAAADEAKLASQDAEQELLHLQLDVKIAQLDADTEQTQADMQAELSKAKTTVVACQKSWDPVMQAIGLCLVATAALKFGEHAGMLESHAMEMFMTLTLFSVVACLFSTSFGLLDTWF